MLTTTTMSGKGQVVIPKTFRDYLKIRPADILNVKLENSRIVYEKASSVDDFYGSFKAKGVITKKDIKSNYQRHISSKHKLQ